MRTVMTICLCFISAVSFAFAEASTTAQPQTSTACTFDDGQQLSLRYEAAAVANEPAVGHAWAPGNTPIILFTTAPLVLGGKEIPIGAYSVYFVPGKEQWELVINKDVSGGHYSEQQDVVRAPMSVGALSQPEKNVSIALGHVAAKQCNLRMYHGKTGAWIEIKEK